MTFLLAAVTNLQLSTSSMETQEERTAVQKFLYPDQTELPNDLNMPIWDHLDELRERVIVGALAALVAVLACFTYSKELIIFLEAPVAEQGVRFLQLSPGEFFFTTFKVAPISSKACLAGCAQCTPRDSLLACCRWLDTQVCFLQRLQSYMSSLHT